MSVSNVFKKLGQGIADLSELNVQTFSGDLKSVVSDGSNGSVIDWEKLLSESKSSGSVSLVASTKIEFDGDSNTYYQSGIDSNMQSAHKTAVEAAQNYRMGILNLFKQELNAIVHVGDNSNS